MKRFVTIFLTLALLAGLLAIPAGAANTALDTAAKKAAAFAVSELPHPGAADDWAVISVVRGGFDAPENWTDSYYRALTGKVLSTGGVLSKTRLTEYARVILGLTAIGEDPANVAGYNLLAALSDYDAATQPGVTSAAYVLLALTLGGSSGGIDLGLLLACAALLLIYILFWLPALWSGSPEDPRALLAAGHAVDWTAFALLAAPFIFLPARTGIRVPKWFFYAFYPVHLFVLYLICRLAMAAVHT